MRATYLNKNAYYTQHVWVRHRRETGTREHNTHGTIESSTLEITGVPTTAFRVCCAEQKSTTTMNGHSIIIIYITSCTII